MAEILIYTDSSGLDGMAGVAAMLCRKDRTTKALCYCLRLLEEHTTYKAEVVGFLLGLHLFRYEKDPGEVRLCLYNQAVLKALDK